MKATDNLLTCLSMSGSVLDENRRASQEQRGGESVPYALPVTLSQVRHTASGVDWSAETIAEKLKKIGRAHV